MQLQPARSVLVAFLVLLPVAASGHAILRREETAAEHVHRNLAQEGTVVTWLQRESGSRRSRRHGSANESANGSANEAPTDGQSSTVSVDPCVVPDGDAPITAVEQTDPTVGQIVATHSTIIACIAKKVTAKVDAAKATSVSNDELAVIAGSAAFREAVSWRKPAAEVAAIVAQHMKDHGGKTSDIALFAAEAAVNATIQYGDYPKGGIDVTAQFCQPIARLASASAEAAGGNSTDAVNAAAAGATIACIEAKVPIHDLVIAVEDAVQAAGGSTADGYAASSKAGRRAAAQAAEDARNANLNIGLQAAAAADVAEQVAAAKGKSPTAVARVVSAATYAVGASRALTIKLVGHAVAKASIEALRSIPDVIFDTVNAIEDEDANHSQVCAAVADASTQAAIISQMTAEQVGVIVALAIDDHNCSAPMAIWEAGQAAAWTLIKAKNVTGDLQFAGQAAVDAMNTAAERLNTTSNVETLSWAAGVAVVRAAIDAGNYSSVQTGRAAVDAVRGAGGTEEACIRAAAEGAANHSIDGDDIPENVAIAAYQAVRSVGGSQNNSYAQAVLAFVRQAEDMRQGYKTEADIQAAAKEAADRAAVDVAQAEQAESTAQFNTR